MSTSVKGLLNESQIQLEREASQKFGSVVEDFTRTLPGGPEFSGTLTSTQQEELRRRPGTWAATSYAASLAGTSDYRPKLKFMFKVEFIFTDEVKRLVSQLGGREMNNFTFMIKTVDRPKVDFEYEDDVNMYNFRTKVLKKIRHRDLTVVFMDDVGNRVFEFFRLMMAIHSPVTRNQFDRDNSMRNANPNLLKQGSGMTFTQQVLGALGVGVGKNNAHRSVVNSDFGNAISIIRVHQIFQNPTLDMPNSTRMVSFDFMNPRIISFDMDELSHDQNDVNLLTMVFDYDWMEMVSNGSISALGESFESKRQPFHAMNTRGAPADVKAPPGGSQKNAAGGAAGIIGSIVGGSVGKGVSQLSSDAIGRTVRTVAGNNRFGQALGGELTSRLAGPVSGLITDPAQAAVTNVFSSIGNSTSRATEPLVRDSTSFFNSVKSKISSATTGQSGPTTPISSPDGGG